MLGGLYALASQFPACFCLRSDVGLQANPLCRLSFQLLQLTENQFTGTLPPEWGLCQVRCTTQMLHGRCPGPCLATACTAPCLPGCTRPAHVWEQKHGLLACAYSLQTPLMGISLAQNRLVGPAFPDTWVAHNTSLSVWYFVLDDNRRLNGTLPARLPWVNLKIL